MQLELLVLNRVIWRITVLKRLVSAARFRRWPPPHLEEDTRAVEPFAPEADADLILGKVVRRPLSGQLWLKTQMLTWCPEQNCAMILPQWPFKPYA
jgi:hypothetical protein